MTARIVTGTPPGGDRVKLAKVLPLDTPLVVQYFPVYACDLKCYYCHHAIDPKKREFITDKNTLDLKVYMDTLQSLARFPRKVRVIRFVGMGEPLLHPFLATMVWEAKQWNVSERVELLTNAVQLTRIKFNGLKASGLDRLLVSVQGMTSEDYRKTSGVKLDFGRFLSQLKYAYENRGSMHIHIKGIDCTMKGREQEFYDLYSPMCDTIGIETAGPIYRGVPFNRSVESPETSQYGSVREPIRICPQPFATMQVNPDGKVVPCYASEYPCFIGDVNKECLYDIWEGEKLREFRLKMLDGKEGASDNCRTCEIIYHRVYPEDSLDKDADRLKEVFRAGDI